MEKWRLRCLGIEIPLCLILVFVTASLFTAEPPATRNAPTNEPSPRRLTLTPRMVELNDSLNFKTVTLLSERCLFTVMVVPVSLLLDPGLLIGVNRAEILDEAPIYRLNVRFYGREQKLWFGPTNSMPLHLVIDDVKTTLQMEPNSLRIEPGGNMDRVKMQATVSYPISVDLLRKLGTARRAHVLFEGEKRVMRVLDSINLSLFSVFANSFIGANESGFTKWDSSYSAYSTNAASLWSAHSGELATESIPKPLFLDVMASSMTVVERGSTLWKMGYQFTLMNNNQKDAIGNFTVSFVDPGGKVVEEKAEYRVIVPAGQSRDVTGQAIIRADLASNLKGIQVKPKW